MLTKDLIEEIIVRVVIAAVLVVTVATLSITFVRRLHENQEANVTVMGDEEGKVVSVDEATGLAVVYITSTGETSVLNVGDAYAGILNADDKVVLSTTYTNGEKEHVISSIYK